MCEYKHGYELQITTSGHTSHVPPSSLSLPFAFLDSTHIHNGTRTVRVNSQSVSSGRGRSPRAALTRRASPTLTVNRGLNTITNTQHGSRNRRTRVRRHADARATTLDGRRGQISISSTPLCARQTNSKSCACPDVRTDIHNVPLFADLTIYSEYNTVQDHLLTNVV